MSPDDYKRDFGRTKNMKNSGLMRSRGTPESGMLWCRYDTGTRLTKVTENMESQGAEGFCLLDGIDEQ